MNNKELAEYMIENLHEDRDCKIIAQAYLDQADKIEGLVEALEKIKEYESSPITCGGDNSYLTATAALTAYKEGKQI